MEAPVVEVVEAAPAAPAAKTTFRDRFAAARMEFCNRIKASWEKTIAGVWAGVGVAKVAAVAAIMTFLVLATIGALARANESDRRAAAYRQAGAAVAAAAESEAMAVKAQLSAILTPKPTVLQRVYSAGEAGVKYVRNVDGAMRDATFGK